MPNIDWSKTTSKGTQTEDATLQRSQSCQALFVPIEEQTVENQKTG